MENNADKGIEVEISDFDIADILNDAQDPQQEHPDPPSSLDIRADQAQDRTIELRDEDLSSPNKPARPAKPPSPPAATPADGDLARSIEQLFFAVCSLYEVTEKVVETVAQSTRSSSGTATGQEDETESPEPQGALEKFGPYLPLVSLGLSALNLIVLLFLLLFVLVG